MSEEEEKKEEGASEDTPQAVQDRISTLKDEIRAAQGDVKILEGRIKNKNPDIENRFKEKVKEAESRLPKLENSLWGLIQDRNRPRTQEELDGKVDVLRQNAIRYFQLIELDPDIWTNIESL